MSVAPPAAMADDDAHRPRRIGLRPRDARHGRQRGSARGQMQKISTGKFHGQSLHDNWVRTAVRTAYLFFREL